MMKLVLVTAFIISACVAEVHGQIFRVAEMNAEQIRALDREKTVVILTGGILEQHGPHLPSFTDGYSNEWLTQQLAAEVVRRRGMSVLLFPTIPLGHEGANEIGASYVFPGTYSVRRSTLRAIFMDLATELGEQGFKWIFIFHGHGGPFHNLMLDEASDYFRDTYGGRMVHIRGLRPTPVQLSGLNLSPKDLNLSPVQKREIGEMDEHAGFDETSRLLFLRPGLVGAIHRQLAPKPVNNPGELFKVARQDSWPGYFSSPRLARANYGALLQQNRSRLDNALALAILDGKLDERDIPRYSKIMTGNPQLMTALAASDKNESERERKQRDWMKKKGIE